MGWFKRAKPVGSKGKLLAGGSVRFVLPTLSMTEMYSLNCGLAGGNSVDLRGNCWAISLLMLALEEK